MIDRFLSLFKAHRNALTDLAATREQLATLRRVYEEQHDAKIRIQDYHDYLTAEFQRTRQDLADAQQHEREALKMIANLGWQQQSGWTPYPDTRGLPKEWLEAQKAGPVAPDYVRAQDVARQASHETLRRWAKGDTPNRAKQAPAPESPSDPTL
jgi:hypothetical protein